VWSIAVDSADPRSMIATGRRTIGLPHRPARAHTANGFLAPGLPVSSRNEAESGLPPDLLGPNLGGLMADPQQTGRAGAGHRHDGHQSSKAVTVCRCRAAAVASGWLLAWCSPTGRSCSYPTEVSAFWHSRQARLPPQPTVWLLAGSSAARWAAVWPTRRSARAAYSNLRGRPLEPAA
jgi:hypothetical protein